MAATQRMDHEKGPEVMMPQVYEFNSEATRSTITPDMEFNRDPSMEEPVNVEDRKERRGESVWRTLNERHINVRKKVPKHISGIDCIATDDCIFWVCPCFTLS
jgi:hypothetical protein